MRQIRKKKKKKKSFLGNANNLLSRSLDVSFLKKKRKKSKKRQIYKSFFLVCESKSIAVVRVAEREISMDTLL